MHMVECTPMYVFSPSSMRIFLPILSTSEFNGIAHVFLVICMILYDFAWFCKGCIHDLMFRPLQKTYSRIYMYTDKYCDLQALSYSVQRLIFLYTTLLPHCVGVPLICCRTVILPRRNHIQSQFT